MPSNQSTQTVATIRFLKKMQERNNTSPFLEEEDATELNAVLADLVYNGLDEPTLRRTHAFLGFLQEHDDHWHVLDADDRSDHTERDELARLMEPPGMEDPAPVGTVPLPTTTRSGKPAVRANRPTAGEGIGMLGIIAGGAAATLFTYYNPSTMDSFFWVGFWAFMFGSSLIGDIRRRSVKHGISISAAEGSLVTLVWALATTAIVVLGRGYANGDEVAWFAFFAYLIGGAIAESITGVDIPENVMKGIEDGADDAFDE